MLQHIQLVVLDLDYTVFDCAKPKIQALRQSLIALADVIPQNIRLPDEVDAEEGFREYGLEWLRSLELGMDGTNLDNLAQVYAVNENRLIQAGIGSVYGGLKEFLFRCREQGIAIALGAEASRDYLMSVSEKHQLEDLFQISLCTEEFGAGSSEEMLEEIVHYSEVNHSEALVLGTRSRFFEAARSLDMIAIGCGWGLHKKEGLDSADIQALTLEQLAPAIEKADLLASQRF